MGKTAQLTGHLGRALDNGVTPAEVSAVLTHLAFYTGWPNAVSAVTVVDEVFSRRDIHVSESVPEIAGHHAEALSPSTSADVAPKMRELTRSVLEGDLWRRTDLAPRDRSLATIAALAASGETEALEGEVRRGLENGLTRDEVAEAVTHIAFYAGWPRAQSALPVLEKAFASKR
jgi:4-carboxymuconolactone decarboxylase